MKITWKTEISELVNVENAVGMVRDANSRLKNLLEPRIDALELEMTLGGLSKQALIFDGVSPLYNKAQEIMTAYESKLTEFVNFEKEVETAATEKRREQLLKLQSAIKAQLEALKASKEYFLEKTAKMAENQGVYYDRYSTAADYRQYAETTQESITALEPKLEQVNIELGKV